MKRAFDILISFFALLLLSPLLCLLYVAVCIQLGSPAIFRQERPGKHAKPFRILKFRTMNNERDQSGSYLSDADRLNKFGRMLRSTSLDELPGLWNVLTGDMSLIGPRPLLMQYLNRYNKTQFRRHEVRPGITGWAQVNGRNAINWDDKFKLDVWYVDNQSFALDFRIIFMTVVAVFGRKNISVSKEVTMLEFMGSTEAGNSADSKIARRSLHQPKLPTI